jgi:hypothetical protein
MASIPAEREKERENVEEEAHPEHGERAKKKKVSCVFPPVDQRRG